MIVCCTYLAQSCSYNMELVIAKDFPESQTLACAVYKLIDFPQRSSFLGFCLGCKYTQNINILNCDCTQKANNIRHKKDLCIHLMQLNLHIYIDAL